MLALQTSGNRRSRRHRLLKVSLELQGHCTNLMVRLWLGQFEASRHLQVEGQQET